MVIDISSYAYNHPGGAFLLDYNVGRDISKFFYGSYALDGNGNDPSKEETERYTHSNIARKIANNNSIGIMK
jgi:cytochrome b involved in lipid metabolism